tara:strand:- start:189 stop:785 length:597 start_codon:yes stop_codon:yes gene_type:complete
MNKSKDLNNYSEIYKDFMHPNPNIYYQAILILVKEFRFEFMNDLLNNLKNKDIFIRRKSIIALGEYGEEILESIVQLYFNSKNRILRVSCLKIIIKIIVNFNLKKLNQETMSVVNSALKDSSPEITLVVISLLRQLGVDGRDVLIKTCRDKDLLRAKASVTALHEMKDQKVDVFFDQLLNDELVDPMIKDDILRNHII